MGGVAQLCGACDTARVSAERCLGTTAAAGRCLVPVSRPAGAVEQRFFDLIATTTRTRMPTGSDDDVSSRESDDDDDAGDDDDEDDDDRVLLAAPRKRPRQMRSARLSTVSQRSAVAVSSGLDYIPATPLSSDPGTPRSSAGSQAVQPVSDDRRRVCPICEVSISHYASSVTHFLMHTPAERAGMPESFSRTSSFKCCAHPVEGGTCASMFFSTLQLDATAYRCKLHRPTNSTPRVMRSAATLLPDVLLSHAQSTQSSFPAADTRIDQALNEAALMQIAKWGCFVTNSIPKAARLEVSSTLRWAIRNTRDTDDACRLTLAFGKLLLRRDTSAATAGTTLTAGVVVARCAALKTDTGRFIAHALAECAADAKQAALNPQPRPEVAEVVAGAWDDVDDLQKAGLSDLHGLGTLSDEDQQRVQRLFELGQFSRANAALSRAPLAPFNNEIRAALEKLHPRSPWRAQFRPPGTAPSPTVNAVLRALSSFPAGSAAGPFGLRADHLKELCNTPGTQLCPDLAIFLGKISNGGLSAALCPFFFAARLVALFKKGENGVVTSAIRPVACGEALRRLLCKVVAAKALPSLKPFFMSGGQAGFGVKEGVTAAAMAARFLVQAVDTGEESPSLDVFLKSDLTNAFNLAERRCFVESPAVAAACPEFCSLVNAAYGSHSYLFFGGLDPILSEQGTQQGCPLAGMLFAINLEHWKTLERVDRTQLGANIWIADDGLVAASCARIQEFIDTFLHNGPIYGLFLNLGKCKFYTKSGVLPPELARFGIKCLQLADLQLLGVAVGSDEARQRQAGAIAERIFPVDHLLTQLAPEHPQCAMTLLRSCSATAKANYFMRNLGQQPAWDAVDFSTGTVFGFICPGVTSTALLQARLPFRLGGCGLRALTQHANAAFIGACHAVEPLLHRFSPFLAGPNVIVDARYDSACLSFATRPVRSDTQRSLSALIDDANFLALTARLESQDRSTQPSHYEPIARANARLFAVAQKGTSLWLAPTTTSGKLLALTSPVFRALLRFRLGLPLYDIGAGRPLCFLCRTVYVDIFGDHVGLCLCGGAKNFLHHGVRNVLVSMANTGLLNAKSELHSYPDWQLRADITLLLDCLQQTVDVTLTHALREPFLQPPQSAVLRLALEKENAMRLAGISSPCDHIAAFDSVGGMTENTRKVLKRIATAFAARHDDQKGALIRFWAEVHLVVVSTLGDRLAQVSFTPLSA